jgi:hypothetical protein
VSTATVFEDVAPLSIRDLSPHHRTILEVESGIAPDIIEARGYHSYDIQQIGALVQREVIHGGTLSGEGWLGIPTYRPDGFKHGEIIRLDVVKSNKGKYVWPGGYRTAIDAHPMQAALRLDRSAPAVFVEGIKKADAIISAARREGLLLYVLAINGNYGWRSTLEGGKTTCPDLLDIPWDDREVYTIPDSDYRTNDKVANGWDDLATYIASKAGENKVRVAVPPPDGMKKVGADDYLASGKTLASLLELAVSPKHAKLSTDNDRSPLVVRSGKKLIDDAGEVIPHIITPLLPEASILLVAGHTGTLKTWHMLDLALSVAFGIPWLAHPNLTLRDQPANVLYVNKEMSGAVLGQRLKLLSRHEKYAYDQPKLTKVLEERFFVADEAILDLKTEVQRDRMELFIADHQIEIVFLDSLSMVWTGDENSNSEVGAFYNQMRQITERTRTCWVPIHHMDKPQGSGKSKNPIIFSIRGAGQLGQQADAALVLSTFYPASGLEDGAKQVSIVHAKARTSIELPSFVTEFKEDSGMSAGLQFSSLLQHAQERSYVASGKDPAALDGWILGAIRGISSMTAGSGSGLRSGQLAAQIISAWEGPAKEKPSKPSILQRLDTLESNGDIEILDQSGGHGKLYRLSEQYGPAIPKDEGD